ncbi:MAG: PorT family protein [Paraprevotella sp.]|nr:PorT family protein [Paraprevotella sp.]
MRSRILTLLTAAVCCLSSGAQTRSERSRWFDYDRSTYYGVRLGVGAPDLYFRHMTRPDARAFAGLGVAAVWGIQPGSGVPLFFETGLMYVEKGAQVKATADDQRMTFSLRYIELPLVFKYKASLGIDDLTLQPFFGGYVALGAGGKTKLYDEHAKVCSFGNGLFRRGDGGLRLGCGLSYQNFYFELSYDVGLTNIARDDFPHYGYDDFDSKVRTGTFAACIGIDF